MKVTWIEPGATLGARRHDFVVCIPVFGAHEYFVACLRSILRHTSTDVPILVCDDASPDSRTARFVEDLASADAVEHELWYLRQPRNVGFPANMNCAFAASAPADVVIVNSDCVVASGWLEGLRRAAYADSTVATATTLTNHGSLVSVPGPGPGPLPQTWDVDQAAAAVAARSLRIHPRLPTAVGHCVYIRRSALELVGAFDLAFSPGYGEEVDFSQRCLQSGLCHVLADDVFVLHHGNESFAPREYHSAIQDEHEKLIAARYGYYHEAIRAAERDPVSPLARALNAAGRSLTGLSVLIDARILGGPTTGTQLHAVELIAALARTGRGRITVLVPNTPSEYARAALDRTPEVTMMTRSEVERSGEQADIVHRPFQINNLDDLSLLARLGQRLVVTNQDLIGYHNPAYFRGFDRWQGYRNTTRTALAVADRVVFFSEHARRQALEEDLLEPARASVVPIGVDHVLSAARPAPAAPRGHQQLPNGPPVLLCIGTDFRHKNRIFALRVVKEMRDRHGWDGRLLLVGPTVSTGSSRMQEDELLALDPSLAGVVVSLPAVTEAEKSWVYERSSLVLYPTVHEGFGLVPFEAADHGVPCLWAAGTSLSEILPDAAAGIVAWNAAATADRAMELFTEPALREDNLAAVRDAARRLTWDDTAARLMALYDEVCDQPATPGSRMGREEGIVLGSLSEDAMRLVGPDGMLPAEVERPLLALTTHSWVGTPVFRAMSLGYQASYRWRRRRNGTEPLD